MAGDLDFPDRQQKTFILGSLHSLVCGKPVFWLMRMPVF